MGLLTARSEYQRFWAKYYGDEARSTSFTKTPKAFNKKERLYESDKYSIYGSDIHSLCMGV